MISNNYNPLDTCTQCQAQFNKRPPDHLMVGKCETCTRATIEEIQNLFLATSFSNIVTLGTVDPNVPVFWLDVPSLLDMYPTDTAQLASSLVCSECGEPCGPTLRRVTQDRRNGDSWLQVCHTCQFQLLYGED